METSNNDQEPISLGDFLENSPPGLLKNISRLWTTISSGGDPAVPVLMVSKVSLYCDNEHCEKKTFFRISYRLAPFPPSQIKLETFLHFVCSNCQVSTKVYAIEATREHTRIGEGAGGTAFKFGEAPSFGPHTPAKLITLVGPDRDAFLKGRRCENQGLGIGAFSYYRRVIENQKTRLLLKIVEVAERIKASPDVVDVIKKAAQETQFSRAMDMAKNALPQGLMIDGQNPLALLHDILSDGLHAQTDEDCLALASSIRIVLAELSENINMVLREQNELKTALSIIAKAKQDRLRKTSALPNNESSDDGIKQAP